MKKRIDLLLVETGHCPTQEKAQGFILAGLVLAGNQKIATVGHLVPEDVVIRILGKGHPYVGRGGLKLEKALREFAIPATDRVALDIGASTGGFTDCLLQRGAKQVYAIDVGHGLLDWKLRSDSRVIVVERTNARHLAATTLYKINAPWATLAVIDVSFISLTMILPAVKSLLTPESRDIIALVKPQFEAKREQVEKGGLVKDPAIHREVLDKISAAGESLGMAVNGEIESPITGAEGNKEFLLWLRNR